MEDQKTNSQTIFYEDGHTLGEVLNKIRTAFPKVPILIRPVNDDAWEISIETEPPLVAFEHEVGAWHHKAFPEITVLGHIACMQKTLDGLKDASLTKDFPGVAMEIAELFVMLMAMSSRLDFKLYEAGRAQFCLMKERKYTVKNQDGSVSHDNSVTNPMEDAILQFRIDAIARALLSLGADFIAKKDACTGNERRGIELRNIGEAISEWSSAYKKTAETGNQGIKSGAREQGGAANG